MVRHGAMEDVDFGKIKPKIREIFARIFQGHDLMAGDPPEEGNLGHGKTFCKSNGLQGVAPPVIGYFIIPITIDITP